MKGEGAPWISKLSKPIPILTLVTFARFTLPSYLSLNGHYIPPGLALKYTE